MYRVRIHEKLWMECDSPEEAVLLADALLDLEPQVASEQPMTVVELDEEETNNEIIEMPSDMHKGRIVDKLKAALSRHPQGLNVKELARESGVTQSKVEAVVYHSYYSGQFVKVKHGRFSKFKLPTQIQTGT